jgi:hypothetical protein
VRDGGENRRARTLAGEGAQRGAGGRARQTGSPAHAADETRGSQWQVVQLPMSWGVFDMPALEGLASEPGSGQPELGPERPVALFDVGVWFEPG